MFQSIEDSFKIKDFIFREYQKKNEKYFATNNFYISDEIENGKIGFNSFDINLIYQNNNLCEKIIPYNDNIYILSKINNNQIFLERYVDLILISNISFSLEEIYINKNEIIKKFNENDEIIDEKLFEDLYFNKDFSNKINIELPKKYNNKKVILEDIDINKKYLFKVKFLELTRNYYEENKINYYME